MPRFALAVPFLLTACTQYSTYGYQYRVAQQFGAGDEPDAISVEARQLLATAHTVAFYPPDYCVNSESGEHKAKDLRATCGVLLSTLERAAEHAGYEVLSWQNLRGSQRPIDYAREANVDVLFEINEFEPGELSDSDIQRTLTFFARDDHGDRPLQVSDALAQTCAQYALQRDPPQPAALTGVIDIKTVAVSDGRDRWHYRKTLAQSLGRTYPQVAFRGQAKPNRLATTVAALGGAAAGIGLGLLIVENTTTNDPTTGQTKFDSHGWSTGLLIGGAVAVAAGVTLGATVGSTPPPPESVLCQGNLAVGDSAPATPTPTPMPQATVTAGPLSAEHTFQQHEVADPLAAAREQIRSTMIAQFIDVLKDARTAPR
jgi:hypothetical protein